MEEAERLLQSLSCIKHEIEEVNFDDEYHLGTKCGSIFYSKDRKYTFICEFCGESSNDMEQLGHHLEAKHLASEDTMSNSQEVAEEKQVELRDYPNREVTASIVDPLQDNKNITEESSIQSIQPDTHDANFIDDPLYCSLCDRHYSTISATNQHKMRHFRKGRLVTSAVEKRRKKAEELKNNSYNAKVVEKPGFVCKLCTGIFKSERQFRLHVITRHDNKNITEESSIQSILPDTHDANFIDDPLYCSLCDRHYSTKSAANQHKMRHFHKGRLVTSAVEKRKKKAEESKLMFRKVTTEEPKQREMANISTGDQTAVRKEDDNNSSNAKVAEKPDFVCEFCSGIFKTERQFRLHVVTRHGNLIPKILKDDPTYLTCDWCNQQYETPLERYEHEKTHKRGDLFLCPLCPKTFTKRELCRYHINIHKGIRPFICPHCPVTFTDSRNLNRHIRVHLGIKPYACDYCDKRFTTATLKKDHTKTHTRETPYQCAECGLRFRMRWSFHKHVSTHDDNRTRDFKCSQCGKAFLDNSQMKRHLNTHSEVRPHVCTECGAAFKVSTTLKIHMQLHSDVKRHECKLCNKRFAQIAGLYSHMKSHREELD